MWLCVQILLAIEGDVKSEGGVGSGGNIERSTSNAQHPTFNRQVRPGQEGKTAGGGHASQRRGYTGRMGWGQPTLHRRGGESVGDGARYTADAR